MNYRPELLLHPQIPKPLHGLNPRSIYGQEWWDNKRQKAYKKYDYHCWACGTDKSNAKYYQWLEAHESYRINYEIGEVELIEIVALCHACHNYIHDGRMAFLVEKGEMEYKKYKDIIKHGIKILSEAGFKKFKPDYPNIDLPWRSWHLLIDGKKYYSKFQNNDEWEKYWNTSR